MKIVTNHLRSFALVALAAAAIGYASPFDPYAGQWDVNTTGHISAARAYRPGEVIVKFKTDGAATTHLKAAKGKVKAPAAASALNSLLEKYGAGEAEELMPLTGAKVTPKARRAKAFNGKIVDDVDLSALYVVRLDPAKAADMTTVAREFAALDEVDYAEPNYLVYACSTDATAYKSDPMYSQQWGIPAINLDKLWEKPVVNTKRPVIAIIDTGVDITHPDLVDNIWTNALESDGAEGNDDDGNGFIDDVHGWDFVNQSARMRDNNGHGTHCAGIAAAVGGNGIGITGANPDALIMPITVMQSDGTGDVGTIIKGIDYATANGADVLSMSFGSYSHSLAEYDALAKAYQKAVLVAAAGNDGGDMNMCHFPRIPPCFPGAYNFVIGVMASDFGGLRAGFSNWDCDGPLACGPYNNEELYSYEVMAPGTEILSTYPGGGYKSLNGTSMACPLVAGAVSRLYQCKEIPSKELLFGDLIHTLQGGLFGTVDIDATYKLTDADRTPTLTMVTYRLDDTASGDGDLRADAGETIELYPTIRNFWGQARNVKIKLSLGENEDPDIVEFIAPEVTFDSELSSYSLNESKNPLRFKINDNCVDGRHIRLAITATCDNITEDFAQEFVITAENGIELGGIITKDMTLYPDKHYIVTSMLGIPENVTLTILPGTTLKFHDNTGISVSNGNGTNAGKIIAKGTPDNWITFTKADLGHGDLSTMNFGLDSEFDYVRFHDVTYYYSTNTGFRPNGGTSLNKTIFYNVDFAFLTGVNLRNSLFSNCNLGSNGSYCFDGSISNTNIIRNIPSEYWFYHSNNPNPIYSGINTFGNYFDRDDKRYYIATSTRSDRPIEVNPDKFYYGTDSERILKEVIWDINCPYNTTVGYNTFAQINKSTRLHRPNPAAPGCLWKVVVDGYDAQDEFEMLPDLGVGRHKFEVYFSKQMNREKTPMVAMGVRPPYTQIAIGEEGSWRTVAMPDATVDKVLTWESSDNNIATVDQQGNVTAVKEGDVTITARCENVVEHATVTVTASKIPVLSLSKDRDMLRPGEKITLVATNMADFGDDITAEWSSSDETVLTVNSDGEVTAVADGTATVTLTYGEMTAECLVTVCEHPAPCIVIDKSTVKLIPGENVSLNAKILPEGDFVDVYTAYLTIKGSDAYDGLNRIYVADAEDLWHFPCPIEDFRFNVNVQSAGSMSAGFMAEPGVGKVTLTWENPEENFDDMLGYNMYRYVLAQDGTVQGDTIRINKQLLDKEELVDYDIVPGTTYCYYYKVLRTSLEENSPSKVVSATPRAAGKGDSNGSGNVDVADVVTDVNFMVGRDPKPFIFDAADVNSDTEVDILDVVGTVNIIMRPDGQTDVASVQSSAVYTIEDGILYVDTPVELAGIQLSLTGKRGETTVATLDGLKGMENTGEWMNDSEYRFISFSLSGKTIGTGRTALLAIGDADVARITLVDPRANEVIAIRGNQSGIGEIVMQQMLAPTPNPFVDIINVPVAIGTEGNHNVELSLVNLSGAKVFSHAVTLGFGNHTVEINAGDVAPGFYLLNLTIDGTDVQSHKVIKK